MSFLARAVSLVVVAAVAASSAYAQARSKYAVTEGDYVEHDFKFKSGEQLPELRLHYQTLGKIARDAQGHPTNAVLILHGTGGSGQQFLLPQFADELFGPGQLLDINRYFIILPDGIGHGKSSKPSDGMHAHYPAYDYDDMVAAQHLLIDYRRARSAAPPVDRGHFDGLYAFVCLGRNLSGLYGRPDAPGVPAGTNRGAQPRLAKDVDGRDPR